MRFQGTAQSTGFMGNDQMICVRQRGFTLIELLVCISIIGLLISLLLPALSSARENARQLKCLTQLRAIAPATAAYMADNKGYGPPNTFDTGALYPNWHKGREASADRIAFKGLDRYFGYGGEPDDTNKFYYRTNGCPTWQEAYLTLSVAFTMNHYILGLKAQAAGDTFNSRNVWLKPDDVRIRQSNTMLGFEHNVQSLNGGSTLADPPTFQQSLLDIPRPAGGYNYRARHQSRGLNFLYVDGHARFLGWGRTFHATQTDRPVIEDLPIIRPL